MKGGLQPPKPPPPPPPPWIRPCHGYIAVYNDLTIHELTREICWKNSADPLPIRSEYELWLYRNYIVSLLATFSFVCMWMLILSLLLVIISWRIWLPSTLRSSWNFPGVFPGTYFTTLVSAVPVYQWCPERPS